MEESTEVHQGPDTGCLSPRGKPGQWDIGSRRSPGPPGGPVAPRASGAAGNGPHVLVPLARALEDAV